MIDEDFVNFKADQVNTILDFEEGFLSEIDKSLGNFDEENFRQELAGFIADRHYKIVDGNTYLLGAKTIADVICFYAKKILQEKLSPNLLKAIKRHEERHGIVSQITIKRYLPNSLTTEIRDNDRQVQVIHLDNVTVLVNSGWNLMSLKDIGNYSGYCPDYLRVLIEDEDFPVDEFFGRWMSVTTSIDHWKENRSINQKKQYTDPTSGP